MTLSLQEDRASVSAPPSPTPITVAYGDGIGPEIMEATLAILEAAGARVAPEVIEIGEPVFLRGNPAGIEASAWDSLRRTRVFLKAPITTPQGGGFKSLNVTVRKTLGLYANVRPCVSYAPFVATRHPVMDVVIVRENEEDVYGGIEHQQTDEVYQCLRLITRPGTEKIVRYAFDYARRNNRRKVTCFTKDNIMKMTDGLFHQVFDEIAAQYPDIENEHMIVDIGAAKLADTPEAFDVVVLPNLYGDILSDVAAQITGSVGLAGSANIGEGIAMFEAIHGSAPRRAGQNLANPSGMLLAGVMMLVHIGQTDVAERVHNAWLSTIEDGIHTYDIHSPWVSSAQVGTREFAEAVIARFGQEPRHLAPVRYEHGVAPMTTARPAPRPAATKQLVGMDMFLHWPAVSPDQVAARAETLNGDGLDLAVITNRGTKVWPDGSPETFCTDHWRCRFTATEGTTNAHLIRLLQRADDAGLDVIKTENLYTFDGQPGFSVAQGQ
jgi:isocitrate dehydrogenase